jgi:hypothetical protein
VWIVRRGSASVVTWRRAQMVLLSAQGMDVAAIERNVRAAKAADVQMSAVRAAIQRH